MRWGLLLVGVLVTALGCARPGSPPGGAEDRIPPMVVATSPDTFALVEDLDDPVKIDFSERISERPTTGTLREAVIISPETGEHEVKHSRTGLEISLEEGFQAGLVYRIRVLPSVKDMFGNPMLGPFELVFSTGGEVQQNALAGVVLDRITDDPVEGARVEARARGEEDPPLYVASTDTAGIYLLRFLPAGLYDVMVYDDGNRNREADFQERQGATSGAVGTLGERTDTLIQNVDLLQPDTTPAQLIRAEAEDSIVFKLTFDDFLFPGPIVSNFRVELYSGDTLAPVPGPPVERLLWEKQLDSLRVFEDSVAAAAEEQARIDSLRVAVDSLRREALALEAARDTLASDSVSAAWSQAERELSALLEPPVPPEPEEEEQAPARPQRDLPEQFFYVRLAEPLEADVPYRVVASMIRNIVSLPDGGGEAELTWTPPEVPSDTLGAVADTAGIAPDTAGIAPDTVQVPPDTASIPPDTLRTRPRLFRRRP